MEKTPKQELQQSLAWQLKMLCGYKGNVERALTWQSTGKSLFPELVDKRLRQVVFDLNQVEEEIRKALHEIK